MRAELDKQLVMDYPTLFINRYGDCRTTAMCWGFACGDGWYPLIDTLSKLITARAPDVVAVQVKEKFGSLRFYYEGGDDFCFGVDHMASQLSGITCEECGSPGSTFNTGWVVTCCDAHVPERHRHGKKFTYPADPIDGIGLGWARLVTLLRQTAEFHQSHNDMPQAEFRVSRTSGQLQIVLRGGNVMTEGMVALVVSYARLIDEQTGYLVTPVKELT